MSALQWQASLGQRRTVQENARQRKTLLESGECTLQRQNAENLKQIFPEKEYRGLSPNFHIHVSVSELHISTMGLPVLLEELCGPILGICKPLTDTSMWKFGLRPRNSQKRHI